jgi:hypothetical protein
MVLKYGFTVQALKGDHAVTIHPCMARLMSKVLETIGNALMDMLDSPATFRSFGGAFVDPREFTLCFRKIFLIQAQETWIFDLNTTRQCAKAFQSHIYPNRQFAQRQVFRLNLTRKAGIPIANGIPPHGEYFDLPLDGTMQNNLHYGYLGEQQTVTQKIKARLLECETIVPTNFPKAGIARLFPCFHPAKEGLESQVNPLLNVLLDLRVHTLQFGMFLPPGREKLVRIVQRKNSMLMLPGVSASGKRFIVDRAAHLQRLHEFVALALRWMKAILEGYHLDFLLVFDVLLQERNRAPSGVEMKSVFFQSLGNLLFNFGNSRRSKLELRPLTCFTNLCTLNCGSTLYSIGT